MASTRPSPRETYAEGLAKYAPLKPWAEEVLQPGAEIVELRFESRPSDWEYNYQDDQSYEVSGRFEIEVLYLVDGEMNGRSPYWSEFTLDDYPAAKVAAIVESLLDALSTRKADES